MSRFFFDVATKSEVYHDFRGHEFVKLEEARQLAELIALDLECTEEGDSVGTEVQVRDVSGACLFCVRVGHSNLMAA